MPTLHIERGRIVNCPFQMAACFAANWEILNDPGGRIQCVKVSPGKWRLAGIGVSLTIELVQKTEKEDCSAGVYTFHARIAKFGLTFSGIFTVHGEETSAGKTSIWGKTDTEVSWLMAFLYNSFLARKIGRFVDTAIEDGLSLWEQMAADPEKAMIGMPSEDRRILAEYLAKRQKDRREKQYVEVLISVVPHDGKSIVQLDTGGSLARKMSHESEVREEREQVVAKWQELVETATAYARHSRGAPVQPSRESDTRFFGASRELGRRLYNRYVWPEAQEFLRGLTAGQSRLRLRVSPEGADSTIPWELLHDGADFLCLKADFARTVSQVPRDWQFEFRAVLIVGSDSEVKLDAVKQEVATIRQAVANIGLEPKVLCGTEATKDNVVGELQSGKYQVLHYAGHSAYHEVNPEESYLLLSDGGKLQAHEFTRLLFGSQLKLVFLNSCSSGFTGNSAENSRGLAQAFSQSGVPYVIGMLWEISDTGAFELAREFYAQLSRGEAPAAALRQARVRVGHKFDWQDPIWASPVMFA